MTTNQNRAHEMAFAIAMERIRNQIGDVLQERLSEDVIQKFYDEYTQLYCAFVDKLNAQFPEGNE